MIDLREYPQILKIQKKSAQIHSKRYKIEAAYNKVQKKARCITCGAYEGIKIPFRERYQHCVVWCKYKDEVKRVHLDLVNISDERDECDNNVYAKVVYDIFSGKQPMLIRRQTGERVSWREAFGDDFETLSKGDRGSLVCLVDSGGGEYRFTEDVDNGKKIVRSDE
jgi:hypothetical protein